MKIKTNEEIFENNDSIKYAKLSQEDKHRLLEDYNKIFAQSQVK